MAQATIGALAVATAILGIASVPLYSQEAPPPENSPDQAEASPSPSPSESNQASAADLAKLDEQIALAQEAGDILSRVELLQRKLALLPEEDEVRAAIADLWIRIGDYEMAEDSVKNWSEPAPGVIERVEAAVAFRKDGQPGRAIAILEPYLQAHPDDAAALGDLAGLYRATGQFKEQIAVLDQLLEIRPSAQSLIDRADAKRHTAEFRGAIADARAAAVLDPENSALTRRVAEFDRLESVLDPIASYNARLAKDPRDLEALLLRAHAWQYADLNERALGDANAALDVQPNSVYAQLIRSRALYALDKMPSEEARRSFFVLVEQPIENVEGATGTVDNEVPLASRPDDPRLLGYRASWFNFIGQTLLARRDADAALAIDPTQPDAALAGIVAETAMGNEDASVARLRALEASQAAPEILAAAAEQVGFLFLRNGKPPLALEMVTTGLSARETAPLLRLQAQALKRLDRDGEAAAALQRAEELANSQ